MNALLIVYSTGEGQTAKIAQHIAELSQAALFEVELCDVAQFAAMRTLRKYDGVIVGGSIHFGKHARRLREFVVNHLEELRELPAAFFSVSLSAAGSEEQQQEAVRYVQEFLQATSWRPDKTATISGAVLYREYGVLKRCLIRQIMSKEKGKIDTAKNYEYTQWDQVEIFTADFLQHLISESVAESILG